MDMLDIGLRAVIVLKGLNEIVLLTLIGQAATCLPGAVVAAALICAAHSTRSVRAFSACSVTSPRFVPDRHLPFVAFFGLLLVELVLHHRQISLVAETMLRAQR